MRDADGSIDDDEITLTFTPRSRPPGEGSSRASEDRLWDANDVASYLKVSRSWVYHRAEAGQLPCVRVGGLLRFDPAAIRASARGEVPTSKRVVAIPKRSRG